MDRISLQNLIAMKKEIHITYRREKDENIKNYFLEALEIKTEMLKDGSRETYLYGIKLPKSLLNSKPQKFILSRVISAS